MRIGIIGYGNMGQAIAHRLRELDYEIIVFDKDKNKIKRLKDITVAQNNCDLVNKVDILILAIKPQDFAVVLREIKNYIKEKLLISIAAGISTAYIEGALGDIRVIRVMPNLGVKVAESVSCLCKGRFATDKDLKVAKGLFSRLGTTAVIEEKMMNAATAISGSGPGYIFDFLETNSLNPNNLSEDTSREIIRRLESAARKLGFNSKEATFLAVNTLKSSLALIKKTQLSPQTLKKQVASKGGTTEAALKILHEGGSWEEAAQAALKRAEELAR
ncbi:MAG: pyrroline-5-carboxylate reductase [Candidatus Omnitrophica bacterium]|nr:pyrroline-5-carboxylate reductase [Candidatus Omnitrophota bacterium]